MQQPISKFDHYNSIDDFNAIVFLSLFFVALGFTGADIVCS
jgi:hypothetical protein